MKQWFGPEGLLQTVFEKIWNLTVLNFCFVVSCLPVVTAGAAMAALGSVNLRILRHEEGNVFSDYWTAFRQNFRQAIKIWLVLLGLGGFFVLDFWILNKLGGAAAFILKILLGALFIAYLAAVHYVFPYTARFSDSIFVSLKNSLMLSGANLLVTASLMCMTFLALFISFYSFEFFLRAIFVWLVLGFAALSHLQCVLLGRVFARYE